VSRNPHVLEFCEALWAEEKQLRGGRTGKQKHTEGAKKGGERTTVPTSATRGKGVRNNGINIFVKRQGRKGKNSPLLLDFQSSRPKETLLVCKSQRKLRLSLKTEKEKGKKGERGHMAAP